MKTIGNIKSTISSRLHGTTLNKLGDFYLLCKEAGEAVSNRIDLQEARRRALLPNAVYDQVYDYSLPSDFKAPISLNKQANNINNRDQSRTYSNQFNNNKKDNSYAVVWEDMVQFLRFAKYLNTPLVIDKADSLTENGTWTVSGQGYNLTLDTNNYMSGIGSLKCDVINDLPLAYVELQIGNDNANYYSKTITAGHFEAFMTGWNLLRFDLSDAVLNGTVDMASIDYINIVVITGTVGDYYPTAFTKTLTIPVDMSTKNYKSDGSVFVYMDFSSITDIITLRLDNITAQIGTLYDINYYSNYVFRNTAGTWIEQPTSDSDLVNLSPLSYRIFDAELSKIITQQVQGSMGGFDYAYWDKQLEGSGDIEGLYDQYERQFPSERQEGQTNYYTFSQDLDGFDEDDDNDGWGTNNNII